MRARLVSEPRPGHVAVVERNQEADHLAMRDHRRDQHRAVAASAQQRELAEIGVVVGRRDLEDLLAGEHLAQRGVVRERERGAGGQPGVLGDRLERAHVGAAPQQRHFVRRDLGRHQRRRGRAARRASGRSRACAVSAARRSPALRSPPATTTPGVLRRAAHGRGDPRRDLRPGRRGAREAEALPVGDVEVRERPSAPPGVSMPSAQTDAPVRAAKRTNESTSAAFAWSESTLATIERSSLMMSGWIRMTCWRPE